jgi:transcriptional regulator with XRE-family HTH domain
MKLGEKIRYLRLVEGTMRGLDRAMTQRELVTAIKKELRLTISQSYLSQIENGVRPHLTNTTRQLLARFFRVHPGYLVDDPEGFQNELGSHLPVDEDRFDAWLVEGADRFRRDRELSQSLLKLARHGDSRRSFVLLSAILDSPGLADRLLHVLRPAAPPTQSGNSRRARGTHRERELFAD